MDFLYPKFDKVTHEIINSANNTTSYPNSKNFNSKKELNLSVGVKVSVVDENVGYNCEWTKVKIIDKEFIAAEFYNSYVYVRKENLKNIGNKKSFESVCSFENMPDVTQPEVDPTLKSIFVPYVDAKNGLYSVRIQTDYEKVLDSFTFENLLNDVYFEGVSVLLASRGYASDNQTIIDLTNRFYTFAYINKDLDLTVTRRCEPLTFTVSIPLRFFNNFSLNPTVGPPDIGKATKFLTLSSITFLNVISNLSKFIGSKALEIQELVNPDKFVDGYVTEFELNSIRSFGVSFIKLMALAGFPLKNGGEKKYELGFDDDLNLVFIKVTKDKEQTLLNTALMAQMRLNAEFNSKRIFNYLLNFENIEKTIFRINALEFLDRFVNYPKAKFETVKIVINNVYVPPDKVKEYSDRHEKAKWDVLKLSDFTGLANSSLGITDTIYSLFLEEKSKKVLKSSWNSFKENFATIEESTKPDEESAKDDSVSVQFADGLEAGFSGIGDDIKSSLNLATLSYILRRVNFKKALFQHIFCYLKGLNPQNPVAAQEIASILSEIPPEIINYFQYLFAIKNLKGTAFARAAINGFPFDPVLFSAKNSSVIYWVKGFIKFVNVLNVVGINVVSSISSLASLKRSKNPYSEITTQLILSFEKAIVSEVLDIVREALKTSCEDDLLVDPNNYPNPYNTHKPVAGFQNSQNSNQDTLNNNRDNALTDTYNPIQFGFDREYTVNLIDSLLNDINCILTPIESVQLLKGKPTELVITLVKNIIKNKYSQSPNDLSFLLTDDNKLKLLFKRLGLTVDEDTLITIEKTIVESNRISKTDICNPEYEKIREEILNDKIPPQLGVLNEQLSKRAKTARKLLDYIKKGETVVEISSFCPDIENKQIGLIKDHLIKNYSKTIENTFSSVLSAFNQEADDIYNKITEKRTFIRKNTDGILVDTTEYDTFYKDLNYNLNTPDFFTVEKTDSEIIKNKLIYFNRDLDQIAEAQNSTIQLITPSSIVFCPPEEKQIKSLDDFFNAGETIYIEWVRQDAFFDSIDPDYGNDINEKRNEKTPLTQELLNKNYFYSISCNAEIDDDDIIEFNFYLNDKTRNRYVGTRYTAEGSFTELKKPDGDEWSSEDFYDETYRVIIDELKKKDIEEEYRTFFQSIKDIFGDNPENAIAAITGVASGVAVGNTVLYGLLTALAPFTGGILTLVSATAILGGLASIFTYGFSELTRPKVYRINKQIFDSLTINAKTAIVSVFNSFILPNIENIKKKNETVSKLEKIAGGFLYHQESEWQLNRSNLTNEIFVRGLDSNGTAIAIPYTKINNKIDNEKLSNSLKVLNVSSKYQRPENELSTIQSLQASLSAGSSDFKDYIKNVNFYITNYARFYIQEQKYFKSFQDVTRDFKYFLEDSSGKPYPAAITNQEEAWELLQSPLNEEIRFQGKSIKITSIAKNTDILAEQTKYLPLSLLNRKQNQNQIACNVRPHYLNLDFFKNSAFNNLAGEICDSNLRDHPFNSIKEILVNLTVRTYVSDLLVKAISFLSILSRKQLIELYDNEVVVQTLFEFMKKDFEQIAPSTVIKNNVLQNKYFYTFNNYVTFTYDKYLENGIRNGFTEGNNFIIKKFNDNLDCNDSFYKLKYFIKREIYHFIKFVLSNRILVPTENTLFDLLYKNQAKEPTQDQINYFLSLFPNKQNSFKLIDFIDDSKIKTNQVLFIDNELRYYIENYYFSILPYFLMANTIEINKRILFFSTKFELYNILAQVESSDDEKDENDYDTENDNDLYDEQDRILSFIDNLSKSPSPAALAILKPKYIKNASFYFKAALESTTDIVSTVAAASDFNIALTTKIDELLTLASVSSWSLLDEDSRQKLLSETENAAELFIYRRLEDGRSPLPFSKTITSIAAVWPTTLIPPGLIGSAYLLLDSVNEGIYIYEFNQKLQRERGLSDSDGNLVDPCKPEVAAQIKSTQTFECTPENKLKTIKETNENEYIIEKNDVETTKKCIPNPLFTGFVVNNPNFVNLSNININFPPN